MGVADHAPSFQLLYHVCAPSANTVRGFHIIPLSHSFPLLTLPSHPSHSALLVTVTTLPRLPQIPHQLIPSSSSSCDHTHSGSSRGQSSLESQRIVTHQLIREFSREGFPFSPPLPSPLSPKLLTGLADEMNLDPSLGCVAGDDDSATLSSLEQGMSELSLKSKMTKVSGDEGAVRESRGVVPPAASSPAPFSRLHNTRRDESKRRSCAITCKVRGHIPNNRGEAMIMMTLFFTEEFPATSSAL